MTRDIRKVKLTSGRTLEVELVEKLTDGSARNIVLKCDQLAHDDLVATFDKLKIHLVKICDLYEGRDIDPESFNPEKDLGKFKVTSFSIGGNDDSLGVTLTGQKRFDSGKVLNLNTPFTPYNDEIDPYEFAAELSLSIQGCIYEANEYLFNEKYAVKQLDLPFDQETGENSDGIIESATAIINKPKKTRKKKEYSVSVVDDNGQLRDVSEQF